MHRGQREPRRCVRGTGSRRRRLGGDVTQRGRVRDLARRCLEEIRDRGEVLHLGQREPGGLVVGGGAPGTACCDREVARTLHAGRVALHELCDARQRVGLGNGEPGLALGGVGARGRRLHRVCDVLTRAATTAIVEMPAATVLLGDRAPPPVMCRTPGTTSRGSESGHGSRQPGPASSTARVVALVAAATASTGRPTAAASATPTSTTSAGSFSRPRCGTGVR